MAGWFDGIAVSSAGTAVGGIVDPLMVLATLGYSHDFVGVLPPAGAVLNCRLQVHLGRPINALQIIPTLGLVQQPWFQFVGNPAGPPLDGGKIINLGAPVIDAGKLITASFQIRVLPGVRVPRPGDLSAFVETPFGQIRPQVRVADEPLVVIRQPGPAAKLEVLSPVYNQPVMVLLTEALVGDARWIRAGSQIAYISSKSGFAQLHLVDASGNAPHRVTTSGPLSGAMCGGPCALDNETLLLHATIPGERHSSIWQVNRDGSNQKRLTPVSTADYLYPHHGPLGFRCIWRTPLVPTVDIDPRINLIADFDLSGKLHRNYLIDAAHRFSSFTAPLLDTFSAHVTAPINTTDSAQNQITIVNYFTDINRPPWFPPLPIPDDHRQAMTHGQFQGSVPAFSSDMSAIAFLRGGRLFKKLFNPQRPDASGAEVVIAEGFADGASVSWRHP